jgi:hypothetical protein
MSENSLNWIEYTKSEIGLKGMFNGNVPPLDRVNFVQCIVHESGEVRLSLNFAGLPVGSPTRWQTNGCDCLQFRMSFVGTRELKIAGQVYGADVEMSAIFTPQKAFQLLNGNFHLELIYDAVHVEVYPFNSQIFDEPRAWIAY